MQAKVSVFLKEGVLDSQGKAIEHALFSLNFKNMHNVRTGKLFMIEIEESDKQKALTELQSACDLLLANNVIENYEIEL